MIKLEKYRKFKSRKSKERTKGEMKAKKIG